VIKTFTFSYDSYRIGLGLKVINNDSNPGGQFCPFAPQQIFKNRRRRRRFPGQLTLINGKYEEKGLDKFDKESVLTGKSNGGRCPNLFYGRPRARGWRGDRQPENQPSRPGAVAGAFVLPRSTCRPVRIKPSVCLYFAADIGILKPLNLQLEKAVNFGFFDIVSKPLLWVLIFSTGISIIMAGPLFY